jgi:hypothetical protein
VFVVVVIMYLSVCLPSCLPACLSVCPAASLKTQQFCQTSSIFELDNVKNETILRDFLIFNVDNIKNEEILRDFLQKLKVECERLRHSATNFLQTIPAPIELENDTCRPQEQDVINIPTPMELQTA